MIHNVIPVNYFGGSGGQFLSSFLYSASQKDNNNWKFSDTGNSHYSKQHRIPVIKGLIEDPTSSNNLKLLLEFATTIPENITVYPQAHFAQPEELFKYFDKQIKIYFEPEQADELIGVIILKNPEGFLNLDISKNGRVWARRKQLMQTYHRLCNSCPDLEPRMLNVSWNELVYFDPDILVSKLSKFTQIPKEDFNMEKFLEWRTLTLKTISRVTDSGIV